MTGLHEFSETLKQPEYVHVLLNPLPVYGLAMGILALLLGLIFRSRSTQMVALVLVFVACLSVWPVSEYGEGGAHRVRAMSDSEGQQWLHEHEERAEAGAFVYYATAALAAAALVCLWKFPKVGSKLTIIVLLTAIVSVGVGGWISRAGGEIRHREFRHGPPPPVHEHEE